MAHSIKIGDDPAALATQPGGASANTNGTMNTPDTEEKYTSHEAIKEWEKEKDQNNPTQNIVALLGIHGMHCKFYEYQNASHITKAFEALIDDVRREEAQRIMEWLYDRELPIPLYIVERLGGLKVPHSELDQDEPISTTSAQKEEEVSQPNK